MKKIHVVGILMLALSIYLFSSTSQDMNSYGAFSDAGNPDRILKIVGELEKEKPMVYNPQEDPNYFSFFLKDQEGNSRKVVLNKPKPMDFEQSEQIVLTGKLNEDVFLASDILIKCPSKYKDEEIQLRKKV